MFCAMDTGLDTPPYPHKQDETYVRRAIRSLNSLSTCERNEVQNTAQHSSTNTPSVMQQVTFRIRGLTDVHNPFRNCRG
jgi:hypothetical protein